MNELGKGVFRKMFLLLPACLFFTVVPSAFAGTVTAWTSPLNGLIYPAGQPITVSGTWQNIPFQPIDFEYVLDGGPIPTIATSKPCQAGLSITPGPSGSFSCSIPPLAEGTHTIYLMVYGSEPYENYSGSTRTFTVSSSVPAPPTQPAPNPGGPVAGTGCGSANGVVSPAMPTTNLCNPAGSIHPSGVSDGGTNWTWACYTDLGSSSCNPIFCTVVRPSQIAGCSAPKNPPLATPIVTTPPPAPPVVTISATPNPFTLGQSTTVTWSVTGATSCTSLGGATNLTGLSGSKVVTPLGDDYVGLRCGATDEYLQFVKDNGLSPYVSFYAMIPSNPYLQGNVTVAQNDDVKLAWSVQHAVSCTATGDWNQKLGIHFSGLYDTGPATSNKSYTITCTGSGAPVTQTINVSIAGAPPPAPVTPAATLTSFSSGSISVPYNTATTLSWTSANATSCTAGGAWSGTKGTSGTAVSTGNLTAMSTFTLNCTGAGGTSSTQSVTVSVGAPPPTTPVGTITSFTAAATTISYNTATTLTWSSSNATSCIASGDWSGTQSASGSASTGNLTKNSTFFLNCSGGTTGTQTVSVTVGAPPPVVVSCTSAANACGSTNTGTLTGGVCSASVPANPVGYGNTCTSAPNTCGGTNSGTIGCTGTCNASTPANPSTYGNTCVSAANSCGQTNAGTISCNGSCSAVKPLDSLCPVLACTSAANACGSTNTGTLTNGVCSAVVPANPATYGNTCTSLANACGTKSTGTIQCNGACSVSTPANPTNYGNACTSAANICGQTTTGTIGCTGSCSAVKPADALCPVSPIASCTSAANACGATNTGTLTGGVCSASIPANPTTYGNACTSLSNACGTKSTGTIRCDGTCSVSTPANPTSYGTACKSAANSCGQTTDGTVACDGSCSAVKPLDSACTVTTTAVCTSAANSCGLTTSGTIVGGVCNAMPPATPSSLGTACTTVPNACGQVGAGTIGCDGTCNASIPPNPAGAGLACVSASNSCGVTTTGITGCDGSCSAVKPADPPDNVCVAPLNQSTTSNPTSLSRTLLRGTSGGDVVQLQEFLITNKYLPAGSAIGIFGPKTEQAVKSFQQDNGLATTAAVDDTTLQKIQALGGNITSTAPAPSPTPVITTTTKIISNPVPSGLSCDTVTGPIAQNIVFGQSGTAVFKLQCKLIALRYLAPGSAVGRFGGKTMEAVKNFQCATGISCGAGGYGKVGPKTAQTLNNIR